jgi:DNA mismatch repair protein MutL
LADQIAAGEVVERPASVVKELVENALDAGARTISIDVRAGGTELIRISDDGCGMDRADAILAMRRHATSKIRTQADLEAIRTLGFRGEALPSIASVSRLRLLTRTQEEIEGTELTVIGGQEPVVSPIGCAVGTTVEVRDLFFNVPARKKFLKSTTTESALISETCLRTALIVPELKLTLFRDGKRSKELLPAGDWAERATLVVAHKHVKLDRERKGLRVRALLGAPEEARSGANGLYVFVNGRPVRERNLARSVAFAYGSVMPPGRYPVGVVHVDVDPSEVDVNVHPQKTEVRFQRGREVHESITRLISEGLGTSAFRGPATRGTGYWEQRLPEGPVLEVEARAHAAQTPQAEPLQADPWGLSEMPKVSAAPLANVAADNRQGTFPLPYSLGATREPFTRESGTFPSSPALAIDPAQAAEEIVNPVQIAPRTSPYRALAQSKRLYILAETQAGLAVIDQHAADERIKYDKLRSQYAARAVVQQRLLLPERVELSEREAALVESNNEQLACAGLDVSLLGATTAVIQGVPALLRRAPPERLLRDLLDELSRAGERGFGDALDMALATMACHGAIRAGDALSLPECQALLDGLAQIDAFGGHCPHGRPVVYELTFDELARKVGR